MAIFLPFFKQLGFNLAMNRLQLHYKPVFHGDAVEVELSALLLPGTISDRDLERRIERLEQRFRIYTDRYPLGIWAPGLVATREMRSLTEQYLPMVEIRGSFERLFSLALRFTPFTRSSLLHGSSTWLDFLQRFRPSPRSADPSSLLRSIVVNEALRRGFIFANYMPSSYGGGFGRYAEQESFLACWLRENRDRLCSGVNCLDAACGSGEGTYGLLRLLLQAGFAPKSINVVGTTVEPLELFAASHAYFPHDPPREASYRQWLNYFVAGAAVERVRFMLEDLASAQPNAEKEFDVVLCNGILGGPFIHDEETLRAVVARLVSGLRAGGIFLASDRFHDGWKKKTGAAGMGRILKGCGLRLLTVAEGVAGQAG